MTPLVPLTMFGWIPVVLFLFSRYPARRAVIVAFVAAWCFLPNASFKFVSGIPEYTKMSATCLGVLLGMALFDADRLGRLRLASADAPMLLWLASPFLSSIGNGLGAYDGVSAVFRQVVTWGLPYFLGRLYLTDLEALSDLAMGFFLGGLVYVPLCLLEIRISPQLHRLLYGFYAHPDFAQNIRMGGYRPMVFMEHGLMVGMWMAGATLVGVWCQASGQLRRLFGGRALPMLAILSVTTLLVKSMGALGLAILGLGVLFATKWSRSKAFVMLLVLLPLSYIATRSTGVFSGTVLVDAIAAVQPDRAASLQFRLDNENILLEKARERILLGWGGWGRARVYNDLGEDVSVTDGLWIIVFGNHGLFGLLALTGVMLLPPVLLLRRFAPARWGDPELAPAAALAVLLTLYMIDCLLNAMVNPMFVLVAGGITSAAVSGLEPRPAAARESISPPRLAPAGHGWRTRIL